MARSNFSLSSSRDREIRQVDDHRSLSQAPWASCQKSRIAAMRSCTFIGNHFPPPSTARAYLCAPCLLQATPIALAPATALYGPAPARPAPWGRRARRSALPARPRSSPARPCRSPMPSPRPRSVADSFRALDQTRQRSPDAGAPDARSRGPSSKRCLRQGKQGDTVHAIAPDAATLRSRHVARRTGFTIIPLLRFVLGGSLDCFPSR